MEKRVTKLLRDTPGVSCCFPTPPGQLPRTWSVLWQLRTRARPEHVLHHRFSSKTLLISREYTELLILSLVGRTSRRRSP